MKLQIAEKIKIMKSNVNIYETQPKQCSKENFQKSIFTSNILKMSKIIETLKFQTARKGQKAYLEKEIKPKKTHKIKITRIEKNEI
jgi:ubiquitin